MKNKGDRAMRSSKPFSQRLMASQASGQAIKLARSTGRRNWPISSRMISRVEAPSVFRMPISFTRRAAIETGEAVKADTTDDDRQHRADGEQARALRVGLVEGIVKGPAHGVALEGYRRRDASPDRLHIRERGGWIAALEPDGGDRIIDVVRLVVVHHRAERLARAAEAHVIDDSNDPVFHAAADVEQLANGFVRRCEAEIPHTGTAQDHVVGRKLHIFEFYAGCVIQREFGGEIASREKPRTKGLKVIWTGSAPRLVTAPACRRPPAICWCCSSYSCVLAYRC